MNKNLKGVLLYIALPVMAILVLLYMFNNDLSEKKIKYSNIVTLFQQNQISEYKIDHSSGELTYIVKGKTASESVKFKLPSINVFLEDIKNIREENNKLPDDDNNKIVDGSIPGSSNSWILSILPTILLLGTCVAIMIVMMRRMGGAGDRTMNFGKAKFKMNKDDKRKTTFADVAGADEEKEELAELVEFLKSPAKFNELGARIPKGVLLVGPPGTGKTLLARAVAGEAGAPFFSISGSDFVEMFVGVGASRVRDLFEQAKKNAPAIIFIDEIDAVGRQRGAGLGGGHDEREQTLNQLLVEMDGFGANEGVIIIAATNRPDILDKALLRPGRFDRQVTVNYPDVKGREEILKVHSRGKPLSPDVDLKKIAKTTSGFTGADLENILNEAALLAARNKRKALTEDDIEEATIKVMMGTEKKSHVITDRDKLITAYHEAGHAIVSYNLPTEEPVHQISIIPRGMAAGFTMYIPDKDDRHITKTKLSESICSLLGGRAAELLTQDDITTGASNDIQRATEIARRMVTQYGMSEKLGPMAFAGHQEEVFLGRDFNQTKNYSEKISAVIDEEIDSIVKTGYDKAIEILKANLDSLHFISKKLIEREKLSGDEFKRMMQNRGAM